MESSNIQIPSNKFKLQHSCLRQVKLQHSISSDLLFFLLSLFLTFSIYCGDGTLANPWVHAAKFLGTVSTPTIKPPTKLQHANRLQQIQSSNTQSHPTNSSSIRHPTNPNLHPTNSNFHPTISNLNPTIQIDIKQSKIETEQTQIDIQSQNNSQQTNIPQVNNRQQYKPKHQLKSIQDIDKQTEVDSWTGNHDDGWWTWGRMERKQRGRWRVGVGWEETIASGVGDGSPIDMCGRKMGLWSCTHLDTAADCTAEGERDHHVAPGVSPGVEKKKKKL